ncbi:uncharacterized protein BCR38DRAFT_455005 [Pseudomassariella vexata]|uniref:Uncharacterized protein n=1 Tax=Pseudomassariella vexata TaxID=1141098 RepID=A0A1Y2EEX8_9PEZI|nr:uncharacterized protein BCR38DRAFT_455005 [Pseudomassariella vexata]ORY70143.1 hypothetical protein BCR38DRAFT_455005 [Pseudomassariella vexata]
MSSTQDTFTLEAGPGTDIWKKPPTTNVWNAPVSHTSSGPLKKFKSARVSFWADWTERYDQAGLLLVPKPELSTASPPDKWIKTGIEFYMGKPQLSTVSCDRYADWSVSSLSTIVDPTKGITLEIVREGDEHGKSVWVYQLVLDADGKLKEKIPLREICWIFADENESDWVLEVSPLVARPEKKASDPLKVQFMQFEVEWAT